MELRRPLVVDGSLLRYGVSLFSDYRYIILIIYIVFKFRYNTRRLFRVYFLRKQQNRRFIFVYIIFINAKFFFGF